MPQATAGKEWAGRGARYRRPAEETALERYRQKHGLSFWKLGHLLETDSRSVEMWCRGRQMPSLVRAFKVEALTQGAVPAESWLETSLAKELWKTGKTDWERHDQLNVERRRKARREGRSS
jgi:predicted transcriptional regulator